MSNTIRTFIVDAFTNEPFKGNPAGVCLLDKALTEEQMLSIAQELGYSETAFVEKRSISNSYSIRFFSPKIEIPLCGHATLASSKVVFEMNPELSEIKFINIQGLELDIHKNDHEIEMTFPIYRTSPQDTPKKILDALGLDKINNSVYNAETKILLIEIDNSELLASLSPNYPALIESHDAINGVLVTAPSRRVDFDFESRYFWPWSGTNEDPVTGGTHTFLAKYWGSRLDKNKMRSFQCSERTGFMDVELLDSDRMIIRSQAQIVLEGELRI